MWGRREESCPLRPVVSFRGRSTVLVVLVGGRGFCRGGGRGWYVSGQLIVVIVQGMDFGFYEAGSVRPPVAAIFVFCVCGVIVAVLLRVYDGF